MPVVARKACFSDIETESTECLASYSKLVKVHEVGRPFCVCLLECCHQDFWLCMLRHDGCSDLCIHARLSRAVCYNQGMSWQLNCTERERERQNELGPDIHH